MNQQELPANAFINPSGSNKESVENFLSKALNRIISVVSSSEKRSSLPKEINIPPQVIPEESIGDEKLIDELETLLLSSINPSHPGGFMTAICNDGTWIFLGETIRFTGGFKKEGKEFSGIWEQSNDGKNWAHFMDIKLSKTD